LTSSTGGGAIGRGQRFSQLDEKLARWTFDTW